MPWDRGIGSAVRGRPLAMVKSPLAMVKSPTAFRGKSFGDGQIATQSF